jgi:uncharacterized protein YcfJ
MKRLALTTLALALAASGSALALQDGYGYRNYNNGGPRSDYAQVIRVEPVISTYGDQYASTQREECWNERTNAYEGGYYRDSSGNLYRRDDHDHAGGTLLGALIGGALGNQVGKGDGRTAATIGGAVIGGAIGNHVARENDRDYDEYRDSSGIVRRCRIVTEYGNNNTVTGYNVTYVYAGRTYHAMTNYNPGRTLRVVVDVRPQDGNLAYGQ